MKKFLLITTTILGLLFLSFKKPDIVNITPTAPDTKRINPEIVKKVLGANAWRIIGTINELNTSKNYLLNFSVENECNIDDGKETVRGKWYSGWDNGELKLKLMFPIYTELASINEDWFVVETTESKIFLKDIRGNTLKADLLILEKP